MSLNSKRQFVFNSASLFLLSRPDFRYSPNAAVKISTDGTASRSIENNYLNRNVNILELTYWEECAAVCEGAMACDTKRICSLHILAENLVFPSTDFLTLRAEKVLW
jgi:hypothetical protein